MPENAVLLPAGSAARLVDVDALIASVDGVADSAQILRMASQAFRQAAERFGPGATDDDVRKLIDDLVRAYFATGALLGAGRELMIKSLRG